MSIRSAIQYFLNVLKTVKNISRNRRNYFAYFSQILQVKGNNKIRLIVSLEN